MYNVNFVFIVIYLNCSRVSPCLDFLVYPLWDWYLWESRRISMHHVVILGLSGSLPLQAPVWSCVQLSLTSVSLPTWKALASTKQSLRLPHDVSQRANNNTINSSAKVASSSFFSDWKRDAGYPVGSVLFVGFQTHDRKFSGITKSRCMYHLSYHSSWKSKGNLDFTLRYSIQMSCFDAAPPHLVIVF